MTAKQFFDLVVQMRKAQNDYFASRKRKAPWEESNALKDISQGYERQVDAEIERVRKITTEPELHFG
jgi:hypothetical protein